MCCWTCWGFRDALCTYVFTTKLVSMCVTLWTCRHVGVSGGTHFATVGRLAQPSRHQLSKEIGVESSPSLAGSILTLTPLFLVVFRLSVHHPQVEFKCFDGAQLSHIPTRHQLFHQPCWIPFTLPLLSGFLPACSSPPKSQFYGNNTTSATPRCDGCSVQCFTEHSPTLTEPRPSFLRQNSHICRVHTACLWPPAGLNAHEHIGSKQHKMAGTCN